MTYLNSVFIPDCCLQQFVKKPFVNDLVKQNIHQKTNDYIEKAVKNRKCKLFVIYGCG